MLSCLPAVAMRRTSSGWKSIGVREPATSQSGGARQNDGLPLRRMLQLGATPRGNSESFHAIAVDARGPMFEGGIVTRVDSVPFEHPW